MALAVLAALADALAVDEQRHRAAEVVAPVVAGHLPAVRGEPLQVGQRVAAAARGDRQAGEEPPALEHLVPVAERGQLAGELQQRLVGVAPSRSRPVSLSWQ